MSTASSSGAVLDESSNRAGETVRVPYRPFAACPPPPDCMDAPVMAELAFVNDSFCPIVEACVSVEDRGFQFADGVYEVVRSYEGKIFALDKHLARFANSLAGIEIGDVNIEQIRKKVKLKIRAG